MFKAKDTSRWELNTEGTKKLEQLKSNMDLAFKYMLPNETREVNKLKEAHLVVNHQLLKEI